MRQALANNNVSSIPVVNVDYSPYLFVFSYEMQEQVRKSKVGARQKKVWRKDTIAITGQQGSCRVPFKKRKNEEYYKDRARKILIAEAKEKLLSSHEPGTPIKNIKFSNPERAIIEFDDESLTDSIKAAKRSVYGWTPVA